MENQEALQRSRGCPFCGYILLDEESEVVRCPECGNAVSFSIKLREEEGAAVDRSFWLAYQGALTSAFGLLLLLTGIALYCIEVDALTLSAVGATLWGFGFVRYWIARKQASTGFGPWITAQVVAIVSFLVLALAISAACFLVPSFLVSLGFASENAKSAGLLFTATGVLVVAAGAVAMRYGMLWYWINNDTRMKRHQRDLESRIGRQRKEG